MDEVLEMILGCTYDHEAAQKATAEDARSRLRVIKHYIRAIDGDEDVNLKVKQFLESLNIEPTWPWSVVGSFDFAFGILKELHSCGGRKCVQKHKQRKLKVAAKLAAKKPPRAWKKQKPESDLSRYQSVPPPQDEISRKGDVSRTAKKGRIRQQQ